MFDHFSRRLKREAVVVQKAPTALPDGSCDIQSPDDIAEAVQEYRAAKQKAVGHIKTHIKARAEAIGAADQLPDAWQHGEAAKAEVQKSSFTNTDATFAHPGPQTMDGEAKTPSGGGPAQSYQAIMGHRSGEALAVLKEPKPWEDTGSDGVDVE